MLYYKIIKEDTIIGVGTSQEMRYYQIKHNIILICDEQKAQYIQSNDKLYRDNWMLPTGTDSVSYINATVVQIDKSEYDALNKAIKNNTELPVKDDEIFEDIPIDTPTEDITVEFIRDSKLAEMSAICNKVITNGFDLELSDGLTHHFSLTIQDQLNIITLTSMIDNGMTDIPYHADGELCKMYPAYDVLAIMSKATEFKTYHTTYFNSLKAYIMALDSIDIISSITYGIDIPTEYQSDVLKGMISNE